MLSEYALSEIEHITHLFPKGLIAEIKAEIDRLRDAIQNAVDYMERTSSDPDTYHAEMMVSLRACLDTHSAEGRIELTPEEHASLTTNVTFIPGKE